MIVSEFYYFFKVLQLFLLKFLGMTGKFHLSWGEFGGFKHPNALRYEAALSLACSARCSVGDQMHPYGFLDDATYELIGKAYKEVEEVEEYAYEVADCRCKDTRPRYRAR